MEATSLAHPIGGIGVGRWAVAGAVLYVVGFIASLLGIATIERLVLEPLGVRAEAGELSLSVRNGVHQAVWGLTVAAVAVPIGRRLVIGLRFDTIGVAILVVGLVLAGLIELFLNEFDRARNGMFDPDHVGLMLAAPPAIVAVALAVWAARAAPGPHRGPLLALAAVAAVGFVVAVVPSLGGVTDGIEPGSLGLAVSLLGSSGFAVLALAIARR